MVWYFLPVNVEPINFTTSVFQNSGERACVANIIICQWKTLAETRKCSQKRLTKYTINSKTINIQLICHNLRWTDWFHSLGRWHLIASYLCPIIVIQISLPQKGPPSHPRNLIFFTCLYCTCRSPDVSEITECNPRVVVHLLLKRLEQIHFKLLQGF